MSETTQEPARTPVRLALRRGLKRRCPRCGEGRLFRRGIKAYERCSACSLLYQPNRGDTWLFMIITDRIPILFGIAVVYFGFHPEGWAAITAFFLALSVPVVATIRERQGVALALDYLVRVYMRDPSDEIHGGRQLAGT
jgi:uncharacterized protein (DUF983 family)